MKSILVVESADITYALSLEKTVKDELATKAKIRVVKNASDACKEIEDYHPDVVVVNPTSLCIKKSKNGLAWFKDWIEDAGVSNVIYMEFNKPWLEDVKKALGLPEESKKDLSEESKKDVPEKSKKDLPD